MFGDKCSQIGDAREGEKKTKQTKNASLTAEADPVGSGVAASSSEAVGRGKGLPELSPQQMPLSGQAGFLFYFFF